MIDTLTVTTDEAAAMAGVQPGTIRLWVLRGKLEPLRRGVRPLRFLADAVHQAVAEARTDADQERLDTLSERWRTAVLDTDRGQV